MIDGTKKCRMNDGRDVRIYATDGDGEFPIHAAINNNNDGHCGMDHWCMAAFRSDGTSEYSEHYLVDYAV